MSKIQRRRLCLGLAAASAGGASLSAARIARASSYSGPLRIYIGFPPGGAADIISRLLSDKLKDSLARPIVVENRPGAGGMIATQQLKAAPADGSVVMLTIDHSHIIIPLTFKQPGYDPATDFTPLAGLASYYNVMAISSATGARNIREFGEWLQKNPDKGNYGIPAVGSVPQFAGLLVGKALGTPMVPVAYRGGAPLVADLLGGQVPAGFLSLTESIDHHRAGKFRVVAVSGTSRPKNAPDIPTFEEAGIKGLDKNPWLAFFGPKGLPADFVDGFTKAIRAAVAMPDIATRLADMGNIVDYAPPAQLQDWVDSATAHWGPIIAGSGYEKQ
ncbi:MAG: Bug family tripartite tricarboxylate transporter substrate binding protein [Lautropia sp.]